MSSNWYRLPHSRRDTKLLAPGGYSKPRRTVPTRVVSSLQGFSQIPDVDGGCTFATVCRLQSILMMLAIGAELDYEMHILDVQTSSLNVDVEEDVFVEMASGYKTNNKAGVLLVMKLNKSLHGLRYSPKNWFGTTDAEINIVCFRSLKLDPCMYIYEDEAVFVILRLYVDDILSLSASNLSLSANNTLLNKLNKQLMNRFKMSNMGNVSRILAMNVTRDFERGAIAISQKSWRTWYSTTVWKAATPRIPPE